jgi:hypothetical protein
MTETEWDAFTDPAPMLAFLRGRAGDRKLRLFAAVCCRRLWPLLTAGQSRRAVEVADRYADEETTEEDLYLAALGAEDVADVFARFSVTAGEQAQASAAFAALNATSAAERAADYCAANASSAAYHAATADGTPSAARRRDAERAVQSRLFRDIFGNPFRAAPAIETTWLAWNDGIVKKLAEATYEHRSLPEGTLDWDRLAVLADALEEAGCTDANLLGHLRGPGQHVRGCFAVDALLGKG